MEVNDQLSRAKIKLSAESPFFTELCYVQNIALCDMPDRRFRVRTDGIRIDADYFCDLRVGAQMSLLLHVCLHQALLHNSRCGQRIRRIWNQACDTVVNSIVQSTTRLPVCDATFYDPTLQHLSAEEAYDALLERELAQCDNDGDDDALTEPPVEPDLDTAERSGTDSLPPAADTVRAQQDFEQARIAQHLEQQMREHIARYGSLAAGLQKEFDAVNGRHVSWRDILWRYVSQQANDFQGYDRRFVHSGLYLEELQGEVIRVWVCIDTSESISAYKLEAFMGEVISILDMHASVQGSLYYSDTELHGPYRLQRDMAMPKGFGGTSFVPFFAAAAAERHEPPAALIYFTDGEGRYPDFRVDIPTLWIIDNKRRDMLPTFGEITHIVIED